MHVSIWYKNKRKVHQQKRDLSIRERNAYQLEREMNSKRFQMIRSLINMKYSVN